MDAGISKMSSNPLTTVRRRPASEARKAHLSSKSSARAINPRVSPKKVSQHSRISPVQMILTTTSLAPSSGTLSRRPQSAVASSYSCPVCKKYVKPWMLSASPSRAALLQKSYPYMPTFQVTNNGKFSRKHPSGKSLHRPMSLRRPSPLTM